MAMVLAGLLVALLSVLAGASTAGAQVAPTVPTPGSPGDNDASLTVELPGTGDQPSQSVVIILGLTILSVAPALLIMVTGFTRIVIVLTLTRNALGLQGVPPNQVLAGLALFLTLFVMGPTLSKINEDALQPLLDGAITQEVAWERATGPIREFMLDQVGDDELELFTSATADERPKGPDDIELTALVPAFALSELKTAFIIGFIVFIPFLVIDIVVSSSLMSMGMMMLPPTLVSLPFKLLLFVMVDGWALVVTSLITSFST
ncbi:MAG: flagellar type III secretion system pore protein FliP [Actinomycetota bacterium]|nr:flagellar type III secretion system pore protein FliP [Actinomycetota bacterium]